MKRRIASVLLALVALAPIPSMAAPRYILTSSSPTACTSIATAAQRVLAIINASTSAQTVTLSVYDEPGSPTCASGDLIYSIVLTASQVVNFPVLSPTQGFLSYGLAYKLSAAAANNIVILYQ